LAPKQKVAGLDLPRLWLFTDPDRLADPVAAARGLPSGSGIIYRSFGHDGAEAEARGLARLAKARSLVLLIGADADLAAKIGADGVHLPERMMKRARAIRARHSGWILTTAVHDRRALEYAKALKLDGAFLSAVLPSQSPSAGAPMGPVRLAQYVCRSDLPIMALGGITAKTGQRVIATGIYGLAAIEGLKI
jgi:thiamine-phosphate pyrophosphorylase